jgi:hypothetical protein
MGAIPVPRTWSDKEIPPYSTMNADVYNTASWLLQRPMCKVRQTTTQSIPNATFTAVLFQTEDIDTYNWHSSTTNTNRITPTFPGWYRGWFSVGMSGATAGNFRLAYVQKSASLGRSRRDQKPLAAGQNVSIRGVPFFLPMNGTTDYFEVLTYQDSGAAMSLQVGSNLQSEFFCRWWAPL